MKIRKSKKTLWRIACVLMLLFAFVCASGVRMIAQKLLSQQEAERWQGESEQHYSQVSCFLRSDAPVQQSEIYTFRYAMLDALKGAGVEWDEELYPFIDAWSGEGKLHISGDEGATDAPVLAVGGQFFAFHPLRLLSGSYIAEGDLSPDRVILDRELAWELFGGFDLAGMRVEIQGRSFVVGGVVDREGDSASRRAYSGEKGFFMSYDAYRALTEKDEIRCYEVGMPEVVKGFAAQLVGDKFPLKEGESIVNTNRFSPSRLLQIARDLPSRSAHAGTVAYPYWENAARIAESECAFLAVLALLFSLPAAITLVVDLIRLLIRGKNELEDELLPKAKENVEEAIRVRARKHWEKTHQ